MTKLIDESNLTSLGINTVDPDEQNYGFQNVDKQYYRKKRQ
jgi:hypothetical protein